MSEFMNGLRRTNMCGDFRIDSQSKSATVMGWVQRRRNLGSLIFIDLRDTSGIVQVVFDDTCKADIFQKAETLRSEFVIAVSGTVRERESKTNKIPTGDIEILASDLKILSESETTPFEISDNINVNELLRLKYRYLDLRRDSLQHNLKIRSKISNATRRYLENLDFLEIETPFLGKSTPEGARDYLVPSRVHGGSFYALPQSPQIYKQLLMIAGYDKYYQITKCFRDEDLRANRQPEFTQIDIEMSFVEEVEDVMYPIEGLVKNIFKESIGLDLGAGHFKSLTYKDAMERFGSDKPDTRFGMEIIDCSSIFENTTFKVFADALSIKGEYVNGSVRAINAKGLADKLSRKNLDALGEFAKTLGAKGLAWLSMPKAGEIKSSFLKFLTEKEIADLTAKLNIEPNDVIFFGSDKDVVVFNTLGGLRLHLAEQFNLINKDEYDVLWIKEFPMFEYSEEEDRLMAVHHPFTAPMTEDLALLETCPAKARAKAYDLVINGQEAGGGSIRINSREIQENMFKVLGFTKEAIDSQFGFFVNAFKYGAPPHGGLAFGLDRLAMLLCKTNSIRDVIAFPKVQTASCLMTEAPSRVDDKQLTELMLSIKE